MVAATAPTGIKRRRGLQIEAVQWKAGTRIGVSATVAQEVFNRIVTAHGSVTPALLVAAAQPADSPLHTEFEWNDAEAAKQAREDRASYLLRSYVVVYRHSDQTLAPPIRGFVPVIHKRADEPETEAEARAVAPRTYIPILAQMTDDELQRRQVERGWQDLLVWRQRYKDYAAFARIIQEIDQEAQQRAS